MSITDVLGQYSETRRKNQAELLRRKKEVYAAVPEIEDIDRTKDEMQLSMLANALNGKATDIEEIRQLRERKNLLLLGAGFPSDYLDPIYTCKACKDTGTLDDTTRCNCFKKKVLEDKLDAARLTDTDISFELFDQSVFDSSPLYNGKSQQDIMLRIKQEAEKYANFFPHCEQTLLLFGTTGLGKTYVSKCIMRRIIERGYTAAFYTAYRLFSLFHSHRLGENIDLSPILTVPLLIVDDIGTEPMTRNVTIEYFFDLLNERNIAGLHTIIVTNLTYSEIKDRYGLRIHSRLLDKNSSVKIEFKGNDVRTKRS